MSPLVCKTVVGGKGALCTSEVQCQAPGPDLADSVWSETCQLRALGAQNIMSCDLQFHILMDMVVPQHLTYVLSVSLFFWVLMPGYLGGVVISA